MKEFLLGGKLKESAPPITPPKEKRYKIPSIERTIEEKRAELELKRLDIELSKLSKPDVNEGSYFRDMLAQQEKHFNQLLEMNKTQNDLKLEIEKLKLGDSGDWTEDLFMELLPLLPKLIEKKAIGTPIAQENPPAKAEQGGENMKKLPTAKEQEEFKKAVKEGKISEEEAYKAVLEAYPEVADKITKEQFKAEYEKIKNS